MKKYFLLATTALLLGTNNVMAETPTVGAQAFGSINVKGEIQLSPKIEVLSDLNWGTIYFGGRINGSSEYIARINGEGYLDSGRFEITGQTGYEEAYFKVHNLPESATVNVETSKVLSNGLFMKNIYLEDYEDGSYRVFADLDTDLDENGEEIELPTGTFTSFITITVNY